MNLKFATTTKLNNSDNVNIGLVKGTLNITQDNVTQINDLSVIYGENLTPSYTDTISVKSNSTGEISGIGNVFKHGIKLTNRFVFNPEMQLVYPLWYKYTTPISMVTKSTSVAETKVNVISINTAYKIVYPDNSYVVSNDYKVYYRRFNYQTWELMNKDNYSIDLSDETITVTNSLYSEYNIRVVSRIVSDPILVEFEDGTKPENFQIDLTVVKSAPIEYSGKTTSLTNYFYINLLSHKLETKTLKISFQSYDGYVTYIVNPHDIFVEDRDFTVDENYVIDTGTKNTQFYVKFPNRNSILNILDDRIPQMANWNIRVPDESTTIVGRVYSPNESRMLNSNSTLTVVEKINQIDSTSIKLTYDDIYIVRGIDNKPLNLTLYSILEDGSIDYHDDIIDDIDEKNRILFVTHDELINKSRTFVRYQISIKGKVSIINQENNSHKMFNQYAAMSNIIFYMIPQDEASTNRTVFGFNVYPYHTYMHQVSENQMSLETAIVYVGTGDVISDILDYVSTATIHPIILGVVSYIAPVSANDLELEDIRRKGTDISYDYPLDIYYDTTYTNYTTVGFWWGRPINLDNIVVVYFKRSAIEDLKDRYTEYDMATVRALDANPSLNLDNYILNNIIKPKIKAKLRVGARIIMEIQEDL